MSVPGPECLIHISMARPFTDPSTVVARTEVLTAEVADEAVLLDTDAGHYYGTNPVGTLVIDELEAPRTVGDLREAILEAFDVDAETCTEDLATFLADLHEAGLIEIHDPDAA